MTVTATVPAITGVHPYADKFPMLPESELMELAESIRANGLRQPIVVTPDGLIIDGRNRYAACERAGVTPEAVVYDGDDLAEYVIDANSSRRHMSTGARAMATALVLLDAVGRDAGKWKYGAVAKAERGGSATSGWNHRLKECGVVLDFAPDLAPAVVAGDLALDAAFRQAEDRRDAERRRLEEQERLAAEEADARAFIEENAPDLAARVDGTDLLTYVEARDLWNRRNREEAERIRREKAAQEAKARAERENAEQSVRVVAASLANLSSLEYPERRADVRAAFARFADAAPPSDRAMHNPSRIRALAAWLITYADELEQ